MTAPATLLGEFLRARRQLVQPEDVGLPRDPARRVAGLRREEVAALAAISPDYYLRLEQGRTHQPSDQVLRSLGRALTLDDDALDYLARIARSSWARRSPRASGKSGATTDPHLAGLLQQWSHTPAFLLDPNQEVILVNPLARKLGGGRLVEGRNMVTAVFSSLMRQTSPAWETLARESLAALRFHSDPTDARLQQLVGALSVRDTDFRRIWARHDARPILAGWSRTFVDGIGTIDLRFQNFAVPGYDGHTLTVFFDEPGTPTAAALASLSTGSEVVLGNGTRTQLR